MNFVSKTSISIVFSLFACWLFTAPAWASTEGSFAVKFKDGFLSVKAYEADITDVFRAIGEQAFIRIRIHKSVVNNITLNLKKLPIDKAISILTGSSVENYMQVESNEKYANGINKITDLYILKGATLDYKNMIDLTSDSTLAALKKQKEQEKANSASAFDASISDNSISPGNIKNQRVKRTLNGTIPVRVLNGSGEIAGSIKRLASLRNQQIQMYNKMKMVKKQGDQQKRQQFARLQVLRNQINNVSDPKVEKELVSNYGKNVRENGQINEKNRSQGQNLNNQFGEIDEAIEETKGDLLITANELMNQNGNDGSQDNRRSRNFSMINDALYDDYRKKNSRMGNTFEVTGYRTGSGIRGRNQSPAGDMIQLQNSNNM